MAKPSADHDVRRRIEQLGRDIDALRTRRYTGPAPDARQLADLETRHAALHRRLAKLEAQARPDHDIADALEADLDGLVESVNRWIVRQDVKTRRR